MRNREVAAISYLWIFSIFVLLAKRDSAFIQHHARRGFILFLLSLVLWPFGILRYGEILVLAAAILGFINASIGRENHIPILSEFADGTLRWIHIKHYWHKTKHGTIKMVKQDHVTPAFRHELKEQEKELSEQEKLLQREKQMLETEEKKLSSLYHRLHDDENELHKLEDEVHTLEGKVDKLEEK